MDLTERQLKAEYVFKGRILNIRVDEALLPDGKTAVREVVEHNGGVMIAPMDDEGNLYFVEQFRYPYSEVVTELPAGKLEKGEDPYTAGIRELKEETGATAQKIISLGRLYPSPGYCGEIIHLYLATGLTFGEQNPDDDEFLEVKKIHISKAVEMVMNGELPDSKTQVGILKIARLLDKGKI
ncbi:MAG: NUDIX hydrolase [Oscillospiraceae bacterium]|nr:NUDIX hydrolase [Oscillospiraceae bacterium]